MKVLFFLFLFLLMDATASQKEYALRLAHGEVTQSDYGEILSGLSKGSKIDSKVYAIDGSYLLKNNLFNLPLELYLSSGLAYFNEGAHQNNIYEATLYLKLYYTLSISRAKVRIGLGEGASFTSGILSVEKSEAESINGNNSQFLNYLDTSIDINIGSLLGLKELENTMLGLLIKHRSGVYGLINNVKKGGSNYNCFYIEQKF